MEYIARKDGERVQTILEHLTGTAELAGKFADAFGKYEWGYCCGILHDIGKYSEEFQHKIKNGTNAQVDHATAGAKLCMEKGGYYSLLAYCIAGHHAGLTDYGNTAISSSLCGRLKKKICDYKAYEHEVNIPELKTAPFVVNENKDPEFALSVFMRMIYSCLVDADFLDTEKFMKNNHTGREAGEHMEKLLEKLKNHVKPWMENMDLNSVNGRRTEILVNSIIPYPVRSYFNLVTKNAVFIRSVAFRKRLYKKYVAPFAGAWIEIMTLSGHNRVISCRSLRGSVD